MKHKEIIFCGMQRSGNHAIIMWILNNIATSTQINDRQVYHDNETSKYIFFNNVNHINKKRSLNGRSYDTIFVSHEDSDIPENSCTYYICRDFLNMLSSRYVIMNEKYRKRSHRMHPTYTKDIDQIIELWIKNHQHSDKQTIYYNHWLKDINYRKQICEKLSIPFKDNDITNDDTFGHKNKTSISSLSSFDERNHKKSIDRFLERYKTIKFPKNWIKKIVANKQLIDLNRQIYNIDIVRELG